MPHTPIQKVTIQNCGCVKKAEVNLTGCTPSLAQRQRQEHDPACPADGDPVCDRGIHAG